MQQNCQTPGRRPVSFLDTRVTDPPTLRFAVAVFDRWDAVNTAARDLGSGGTPLQNISCLGLHRVLARRTDVGFDSHSYALRDLPFPSEPELICCTVGSVAERLARRLNLGAQTLQDAPARWLIERHAAQLVQAIQGGKINVWVQLFDNDDERRAYQSLLAQSSDSVSVHDLVGG